MSGDRIHDRPVGEFETKLDELLDQVGISEFEQELDDLVCTWVVNAPDLPDNLDARCELVKPWVAAILAAHEIEVQRRLHGR